MLITIAEWGCSVEGCTGGEGGILYNMGKNRTASIRYIRELAYLEPMEKIYLCSQHYQTVLCKCSFYLLVTSTR